MTGFMIGAALMLGATLLLLLLPFRRRRPASPTGISSGHADFYCDEQALAMRVNASSSKARGVPKLSRTYCA
jgi:hypothetical protein